MSFKSLNFLFFKFFIFTVLTLFAVRLVTILSFASGEVVLNKEMIETFLIGLRFDLKLIATIAIAVIYLPYLFFQKYINYKLLDKILYSLYIFIVIISFINYGYYLYFNSEFNFIFFGIINDGPKEVLTSMIHNKKIVLLVALFFVFKYFVYKLWVKFNINIKVKEYKKSYILYTLLSIAILFIFARGSFGTFPLSKKTINTIDSRFLSNVALNPIWQLYYAYGDLKLNRLNGSKKVLKVAKVKSYDELLQKSGLKGKLFATTENNETLKNNPPNVIFVLMEGWSSYIAMFDGVDNNVLGNFRKHRNSDYFYLRFFSNGYGTNSTIEWLLLNSPIKDLSQSKAIDTKFSTFALNPFKEAGYETLFLSGGSSSWRNHNKFWINQGFDRYIGRATIEKHFNTTCDNTWGVYEDMLFDYLKTTLKNRDKKPTFTFVLTTNNHSPVELPESFKPPKLNLKYYGLTNSDDSKKEILNGYYYQTNALGKFLNWLKSSEFKDNTIVVATGDHIRKNFKDYRENSDLFIKYAVPFYLYLPKKYDKLKNISTKTVGSHNDIFPTLYNLSLSNAKYYNFGTPYNKKKLEKAYGFNEQKAYLFNEGVVNRKLRLYKWENNYTLQNTPSKPSNYQKDVVKKIKYQNYLKSYILNREYEEKR